MVKLEQGKRRLLPGLRRLQVVTFIVIKLRNKATVVIYANAIGKPHHDVSHLLF